MVAPTTGTVYFDGKPCRSLTVANAIARGIVTVPQEFNLVNDLTVAENIFPARTNPDSDCFAVKRWRTEPKPY